MQFYLREARRASPTQTNAPLGEDVSIRSSPLCADTGSIPRLRPSNVAQTDYAIINDDGVSCRSTSLLWYLGAGVMPRLFDGYLHNADISREQFVRGFKVSMFSRQCRAYSIIGGAFENKRLAGVD